MDISKLIDKWQELFSVYDAEYHKDFFSDINKLNDNITLAMKLDETYLTAAMILRNSIEQYLSIKSFSFRDAFSDRKRLFKIMGIYDELIALLEGKELRNAIEGFKSSLRNGITKSGFTVDKKLKKLLKDEFALAELRLSALNALSKLRVDQFASGKRSSYKEMATKGVILNFSDINVLLRALKSPETNDGVYLSLIEDEADFNFSFFVFSIKNGENIWIISDKPELPQPNYRHTGRGRAIERGFEKRVLSYFFPYELLVKYNGESKRFEKITRNEYLTAIQNYSEHFGLLGTLDDCDTESKLWVFMMLGLYQNKFFVNNDLPQLPELSYTNLMVEVERSEEKKETDDKSIVPFTNALTIDYAPLQLKETTTHISAEATDDLWEAKRIGHLSWMEERYGSQIMEHNAQDLLKAPNEALEIKLKDQKIVSNRKVGTFEWANGYLAFPVGDVRLSDFGTKTEVERTVRWQARYVKAKQIQLLAEQEYEKTKEKLMKWYRNALEANMDAIVDAIAKGEFISVVTSHAPIFHYGKEYSARKNILRFSEMQPITYMNYRNACFSQGDYKKRTCYFTGQHATVYPVFTVNNAQAIADVCGLEIKDLPETLQHFNKSDTYTGNSILSMLDPMDHIHDPFSEHMDFDFSFFLSKRYFNKLKKERGQ